MNAPQQEPQDLPQMQLGRVVVAAKAVGTAKAGERGVVYEVYKIGSRPGWGVIFEGGFYDGFSPWDVQAFLTVVDATIPEMERYEFRNVGQLGSDFDNGRIFPESFLGPRASGSGRRPR